MSDEKYCLPVQKAERFDLVTPTRLILMRGRGKGNADDAEEENRNNHRD